MSTHSEPPPSPCDDRRLHAGGAQRVIDDTRRWLERAVIGLNLCPFAKAVQTKSQIHYAVSDATTTQTLLQTLEHELDQLLALDSEHRNTTLIIVPHGFADFLDFNDFLAVADDLLIEMELNGILQIASFHPQFQFADTRPDDITNATNRAPYPTLHLLREASVDIAVAAFPEAEQIFAQNIKTLEKLGADGWQALGVGATTAGIPPAPDDRRQ